MTRRNRLRALVVGAVALATGVTALVVPLHANAATTTVYQAESATIVRGTVVTDHAGYTGTGFVDYDNVTGGYVEFAVPASVAGEATLSFRYANGTTTSRTTSVSRNGAVVAATLDFPGTGSWTTWQSRSVTVSLQSGQNLIRLTGTSASGGPNLDSLTVTDSAAATPDWSVALVNSTMARYTPAKLGGWDYTAGLYLYGQYLVYQRTHDPALLSYIRSWVDRFVQADGTITGVTFDWLDRMQPGNIVLALYQETHQTKYLTAATAIYRHLMAENWPRTSDGGLWHTKTRPNQLWIDGVYMALPFLLRYGAVVGNQATTATADAEAVNQLLIYDSHVAKSDGLLYHAYDQTGTQSWADPVTKHSPEVWCRADGWYAMATVAVLDAVPANQPNRAKVLANLQKLVAAMKTYQDPTTGRWFEVVDKGSRTDNWTETSCSAMYTYVIARSIEQGYVDVSYQPVADQGYAGVLKNISLGTDGRTNLTNIVVGTEPGTYAYYVGRPRATNDLHGLGSFLIMNEQLRK